MILVVLREIFSHFLLGSYIMMQETSASYFLLWILELLSSSTKENTKVQFRILKNRLRFLDATTHLYQRSCPSVGPSVRPSVHPSVRPYVPCYFRRWKVRILGASCAVYPALFSPYLFSFKLSHFSPCYQIYSRPLLWYTVKNVSKEFGGSFKFVYYKKISSM